MVLENAEETALRRGRYPGQRQCGKHDAGHA
jgi:hypothetical protein